MQLRLICLLALCGSGCLDEASGFAPPDLGEAGSDGSAVSITITPGSATTLLGATVQFAASSVPASTINWSVQEGLTGGTVDQLGLYTAPKTTGTFHVIAAGGGSSAAATVTVRAQTLDLLAGGLTVIGSGPPFQGPSGVAVDGAGNVLVADSASHTIRKITPSGLGSVLAGASGQAGSTNGNGSAARFSSPIGIAVDSSGNVYIAEYGNSDIRKINTSGDVTTVAGMAGQTGDDDGTGAAARFNGPEGITVDVSGNLWVSDTFNHTIRKIAPGAVVTTVAGSASHPGAVDDTGSAARFNSPHGIVVDAQGNAFVADSANHLVRKIAPGGVVTTLAGQAQSSGHDDGSGTAAQFDLPWGLAIDAGGNLYVGDNQNYSVRRITSGGIVTTLAGLYTAHGYTDGTGSAGHFYFPEGVACDSANNIYVADTGNAAIRKVTSAGVVTTFNGTVIHPGSSDGALGDARLNGPAGVGVDSTGNFYVADTANCSIRKITPGGLVTTFAGKSGLCGSADGPASVARFNGPTAAAVDGSGNVLVSDTLNATVRRIAPNGTVSTLAGASTLTGSNDGTGSSARFDHPMGLVVDQAGSVFVVDSANDTVRKITAAGVVSTIAGVAQQIGSTDGSGGVARFNHPQGITLDPSGYLYVTDTGNQTIRKLNSTGTVSTFAGGVGVVGSADGAGTLVRFKGPSGITSDMLGNIYVADEQNFTIRKINSNGLVSTLAGNPGQSGIQLGALPGGLKDPVGIAATRTGDLAIVDPTESVVLIIH